tara:strand:- start:545 stop:1183 length:639 start_codon:yes stop_codon:yes gene_type:complete
MIIVISCSGSKNGENLIYKNNEITFVSSPNEESKNHFNPDNQIPNENRTWREYVNSQENNNILESYKLYKNKIYSELYEKYKSNLFILSAGWGIINSEFKVPKYDITFSKRAEKNSKRKKTDFYKDFNHIEKINHNEKIVFFGGADYLKLFYNLTKDLSNEKIIFYNKKNIYSGLPFLKNESSFKLIKYETKTRTNWHYGCAKDFLENKLVI